MSRPSSKPAPSGATPAKHKTKVVHYSLRPAKNIERKMMGETFARLAPLCPLSKYRYIGFGSEFFNDFALYHETLGIRDMLSIEHDVERVPRCEFNRPYKCIKVEPGTASEVLPKLKWEPRSIVWLDYVDKLKHTIVEDIKLVVSQAASGSLLVWSVNAEPWDQAIDKETGNPLPKSELPPYQKRRLVETMNPTKVPTEWIPGSLSGWELAGVYYKLMAGAVKSSLADRNASANLADKLTFHQCFHFRYSDGQRMLTVGGVLLNPADAGRLGADPFDGLTFVRTAEDAVEINPPMLTGREVRHLNRLFPHDRKTTKTLKWLKEEEIENFRQVYRYYPVYAESEL
jgi:hypothetical protein